MTVPLPPVPAGKIRLWKLTYKVEKAGPDQSSITHVAQFYVGDAPSRQRMKATMHHSDVKLEFTDVDPNDLDWKAR